MRSWLAPAWKTWDTGPFVLTTSAKKPIFLVFTRTPSMRRNFSPMPCFRNAVRMERLSRRLFPAALGALSWCKRSGRLRLNMIPSRLHWSEQGTANWISEFLWRYHAYDPHTTGATAVSWFWGLLTVGCFIGMLLLKIFDSRRVLIGFSLSAILCLTAALFGPSQLALYAFPGIGLFGSIMWPVLVSLALNSVSEHHGPFAGVLSTGIMGGAVVPLIIGRIGDHFGLRTGLAFLYITFGCVLSVGFWAKPLITNATVSLKRPVAEPVS